MEVYEVDSDPFSGDEDEYLFHGRRRTDSLPVVLKRHDFGLTRLKDTQRKMNQCLNAALSQAKLQHPNVCDVLELSLEIDKSKCSIYHILESLDTDLGQEIHERAKAHHPFSESEVRELALQTATALAYAHSQNITHRDVKPSSIFRSGGTYKLGDFGGCLLKRDSSDTRSCSGDQRYMSPQLLDACVRGTPYNAFKTDVYALGPLCCML